MSNDGTQRDQTVDPGEQLAIAQHLAEELTEQILAYIQGQLSYEELSFHTFDTLESLHAVATGDYELDYDDDELDDHPHDHHHTPTETQEDLAQEPSRES